MIYIGDDIPNRPLSKHGFASDIEGQYIELSFRKCKWLLLGAHHHSSQSDQYYFYDLDKSINTYSNYEKNLLARDFNSQMVDHYFGSFLYQHELSSIVKESKYFKNVSNLSCIDLILTNSALSFQHTLTVSCGLSDFHKLVLNFNDELIFFSSNGNTDSSSKFNQTFLNVWKKYTPLKND